MFGVSLTELLLIFVVALIAFGPDKLPEIAKALGKLSRDLHKASNAVRREFYNSVYEPAGEVTREIRSAENKLVTAAQKILDPSEMPNCETTKKLEEEQKTEQKTEPKDGE